MNPCAPEELSPCAPEELSPCAPEELSIRHLIQYQKLHIDTEICHFYIVLNKIS